MSAWLTQERRENPRVEDVLALLEKQTVEMATQIELNRRTTDHNCAELQDLHVKVDVMVDKLNTHEAHSREIIEAFRFSQRLRKWFLGIVGAVALILTMFAQGHDLFYHLKQ